MIKVGDRLPEAEFITMTADGTQRFTTDTVFSGRKVVLFAVPGAFTPTCSMNHLPGFVKEAEAIKAKGVDTVACTSVNDVHVMNAWARSAGADGRILMLADGNGAFTKAPIASMPFAPEIAPIANAPISSTTLPFSSTSRRSSCETNVRSAALRLDPALASQSPAMIAGVSINAVTATMKPS